MSRGLDQDEFTAFPDYKTPSNRTYVYPFQFDRSIQRNFSLGNSSVYLECSRCRVKGEIDMYMVIQGNLFDSQFGFDSYMTGDLGAILLNLIWE